MSRPLFFSFISLLICTTSLALPAQPGAQLDQVIKRAKLKIEDFGIFIGTDEASPMYARNISKKLIPASVTKLITAAAVFQHFPPGTKFKTQFLSDAKIVENKLKGSLYLKGAGDPSFVSETLWVLINHLTRTGVTSVEGDLVVDDSLFDENRFDPSRQSQRVDRAYDAPAGAMSFNWNSVNVYVRPSRAGEPADVFLDPANEYLRLINSVQTVATDKRTAVSADREDDSKGPGDIVRVNGQIAIGAKELVIYKNIYKPDLWSGFNAKAFLAQRGITVKGKILNGQAPDGAAVLAEVESKPIEQIVADMNKFSNNYVAEMLTKHLGALRSKPGSIRAGMEVISDYLTSLKVKPSEYVLVNPSGFTRENRFSALTLWKVLRAVEQDFKVTAEFTASLPIAGVDGTLRRRMKNSNGERLVRAKTGLLNGVTSLAGFAGRKDGKSIPFVVIYNGNADDSLVRQTIDQLLLKIVD